MRNLTSSICLILPLLLCTNSVAEPALDTQWLNKHKESISTRAGKDYEDSAVRTLLNRGSFMKACEEKGMLRDGPFVIYFEVNANGQLSRLSVTPDNAVTRCYKDELVNSRLPKPPAALWVGIVTME